MCPHSHNTCGVVRIFHT
uniref:Uncharacterized protein n=1 Tax=Anguilla anguilla TaxID=7936 RepID=A0A0E9ST21_ANGAN